MNCTQIQNLLADSLGNELAAADRAAFDAHLQSCDPCRREHATLAGTLDDLQRVGRAPTVHAHREGNRLVIELAPIESGAPSRVRPETHLPADSPRVARTPTPWQSALRYAAVILLAFAAGYTASRSSARSESPSNPVPNKVVQAPAPTPPPSDAQSHGTTFETALMKAHERNPGASDLAKCMRALLGSAR